MISQWLLLTRSSALYYIQLFKSRITRISFWLCFLRIPGFDENFSLDLYMQKTYQPAPKLLNLTLQFILVSPGKPTVKKLTVSSHSRMICTSKLWSFPIYWLLKSFLVEKIREGQIQLTVCFSRLVSILGERWDLWCACCPPAGVTQRWGPGEDTEFLLHCLRSLWVINKRCTRPHLDMECAHSITHPGKGNIRSQEGSSIC